MWTEYGIEKKRKSHYQFVFFFSPLKYAITNIPTTHIREEEAVRNVCVFLSYAQLLFLTLRILLNGFLGWDLYLSDEALKTAFESLREVQNFQKFEAFLKNHWWNVAKSLRAFKSFLSFKYKNIFQTWMREKHFWWFN